MTPQDKSELFRVLANVPRFQEWVKVRQDEAMRILKTGDGLALHRAQGQAILLDEMLQLMGKQK